MHDLATTSQEHDTDMAAAEAAAQAEAAAHCAEPGHEYYTCPRCQLDRPVADFLVGGEDGGQTLAHCCRACLYEEEQQAAMQQQVQQLLAAQVVDMPDAALALAAQHAAAAAAEPGAPAAVAYEAAQVGLLYPHHHALHVQHTVAYSGVPAGDEDGGGGDDVQQIKTCTKCKQQRLLTDFPELKGRKKGRAAQCRQAGRKVQRRRAQDAAELLG
jgi:hypothetical protein